MTVKQTFTQAEIDKNQQMLQEESYEDSPLSQEDAETLGRLYKQYQERQQQAQREQHKRQYEALPEIGRRK